MIGMKTRLKLTLLSAMLLLLATPVLAGDLSPLVVKYSVHSKSEKIGWSKATIKHTPKGKVIKIRMSADTKIMGVQVSFDSKTSARFDAKDRVTAFSNIAETPKGEVEIEGKRKKGGFTVTRSVAGEKEEHWYPEGSFEHVSIEPAFLEGKVGTKKKLDVLFASSGKIRKTTMKILGREKRLILGEERTVTHYRLKAVGNTLEEWRTDDGIIVKSLVSFPMGKLSVKMLSK